MQADLILYNGRFYTMEAAQPLVSAVAISGNRIVALGDNADLHPLLHPSGRALDLEGRAVTPGLIDAHIHFGSYCLGIYRGQIDLDNVPAKEEALARVAAAVGKTPPSQWVQGGGWNRNIWSDPAFPTAADLDAISPHHPVALEDKSHHATWVNTSALEAAGITAATPDPAGGEIVRDLSGQPTGMLLETAAALVHSVIPDPDVEITARALSQGIKQAWTLGLTGVHDPGPAAVLAAYQVLHARGELGIRTLVHIPTAGLDAAARIGLRSGFGDETLRIGGLKVFADGALGPQTAHMLSPYEGSADNLGIPTHSAADLVDLVRHSHGAGLSVAVHAIGDAANRAVLDAIETSQRLAPNDALGPSPSLPDRIEHVQLLHPDDVPRFAQLGVVASMQPIHATSDREMAEHHWGDRCAYSYAWNSLLKASARLAFGSDCPIETLDPLAGIHAAVTRRWADGQPRPNGWIPAQRLTVAQTVHAYTLGAAYASGEEHLKGSLAPGKLADLAVLSRDIFQIDPMEIADTHVGMTIYNGQVVYRVEN